MGMDADPDELAAAGDHLPDTALGETTIATEPEPRHVSGGMEPPQPKVAVERLCRLCALADDASPYRRSASPERFAASRARSVAVDAAYRRSISRLRQPASIMTSPSCIPWARLACAQACRNACG